VPEIFDFPESYPASPWIHQAASGHIPHAQLIISQNGGLAWPAVQRYVQSLVCHNGGCGTCDGCIQHRQLAHPDVHYIFPVVASASGSGTSDSFLGEFRNFLKFNKFPVVRNWIEALDGSQKVVQISVKEAKRMGDLLSLTSHSGGYKILVIWLPERLHESAANKLLKTLEEPEPKTIILLISHQEDGILGTIRSRCQTLYLPPWGRTEVERWLIDERKIDPNQAKILSALSGGEPGVALDFLENRERLLPLAEHFVEWLRLAFKKDLPGLQQWVDHLGAWNREQQRDFLVFSGGVLSQLERKRHQALRGFSLDWFPEVSFNAEGFSKLMDRQKVSLMHKTLDDAFKDVGRNVNARLVFFDASLQLMKAF